MLKVCQVLQPSYRLMENNYVGMYLNLRQDWHTDTLHYTALFNRFSMEKLGFFRDVEIKLQGISIQGKFRSLKLVRSNLDNTEFFT